jgi:hypothetical protein
MENIERSTSKPAIVLLLLSDKRERDISTREQEVQLVLYAALLHLTVRPRAREQTNPWSEFWRRKFLR